MKVSDVQPQRFGAVEEPVTMGSKRDPFATYVILSAAVHGAVILGVLGSVWLWGTPTYYTPPPYTVSLVDAPLTLRQPTQAGGGEKPSEKPAAAGDRQAAAPAELAAKPVPVEQPPVAVKVIPAEPVKVIPAEPVKVIPAEPVPKVTPPAPKAVAEPQEKKAEAKDLKKPAPEEPKKPLASPPQPPSATATEARQVVDKLRERQAQEAKAQTEAAQAQQRAAEERLAALRTRYGNGAAGGSGPGGSGAGGGGTGSSAVGPLSDLQRIRMQAYQERVRGLIIDAWILPMPRGEARNLQATALLVVSRDGHVARFQLLKTSGNPMFDESLLRAIKQADPLPPLPEDYQGDLLEVELRFKPREA